NRAHWAETYLEHAGLVERPRRGVWRTTAEGRKVLDAKPDGLTLADLRRYPGFDAWQRGTTATGAITQSSARPEPIETPEEALERSWASIKAQRANELLEAVKSSSPSFFEHLVVELLVRMGYGGSVAEAGEVLGHPGDGGIDGLIKEDSLGLERIYLQAKKWEGSVGRPEIQKFVGSLEGEHAAKGVFLTTSKFSPDAWDYVKRIGKRIVLVDGERLAALMVQHRVGVVVDKEYVIPKLDPGFFEE
ncbi:MAG: restriction endonuclease, partial [Nitrososphaerales archaeon]